MRFVDALVSLEISEEKKYVQVSLIFLGMTKYDCVIKTREIFSFLTFDK